MAKSAHGRLEQRTLLAVEAPPDLGFPYARQVMRPQRRPIDKRTGEVLSDETADAVTTHFGCAPQAFAAFRNLALSWLHPGPDRNLTAAREYYASHLNVLFRRLQLTPAGL